MRASPAAHTARSSPSRSSSASVSENFRTGLRTDLRGAKHPIKKMFTPAQLH